MIVLNSLLMALECFFGGSLVLALALVLSHGKAELDRLSQLIDKAKEEGR